MEGLVNEHSVSARSVAQQWQDSAKAADKSAAEITEKEQTFLRRVRERVEHLRNAERRTGVQELTIDDEPETEDVDPEAERFSRQLFAQQQSMSHAPATAPPPDEDIRTPGPTKADAAGWQEPSNRRLNRWNQQPPAAPPAVPRASKPGRRSQFPYDDDDDFENQTWLR
jgi:hypothetical protein